MTQIVYDGESLYADRVAYTFDGQKVQTEKIKTLYQNGKIYHYAFCGGFTECTLGEKIIESNFDPLVISDALQRTVNQNLETGFNGILVEVPADPQLFNNRRVWLCNYTGDRVEVENNQFFVLGGFAGNISSVKKALDHLVVDQKFTTESIIRAALVDTEHDQKNYTIDRVHLKPE